MQTKQRLSASIDADVLDAGRRAVARGRSASLSAWVEEALRRQAAADSRAAALEAWVVEVQREDGPLSDEDVTAAEQRAQREAVLVRPRGTSAA